MVAYSYPNQLQPMVPLGLGTEGVVPLGVGYGYGAPYPVPIGPVGVASGAWYAFFIILFIVIILFWGIWAFGGYYN